MCMAVIALSLVKRYMPSHFLDATNRPNAMHATPVARIGWIGVLMGTLTAILLAKSALPASILLIALGLCAISAIDDLRGLPVWIRLGSHLLAAIAAATILAAIFAMPEAANPAQTFWPKPTGSPSSAFFFILVLVWVLVLSWMTNIYNFMDGANGLAGFMGVIGFGAMALLANVSNTPSIAANEIANTCAAICGAMIGFLFFNFPRARVFLGDAGAIPLGFLAAAIGIYGTLHKVWPWWAPVIVFSPFIVDATVTLLKRTVRRERIWQAHRQHYYHQLILTLGWSHTRTAIAYALLMLACASWTLWSVHNLHTLHLATPSSSRNDAAFQAIYSHLWGWMVIYTLLLLCMEWRFHKQKQKTKKQ